MLGIFSPFELPQGRQECLFFFLPFGGLRLPEFLRDFSVQAVHVSLLQPFAELGQPLFDSLGLALPERFLTGFIGEQGLFELR
ncbi:MAG TPA: hypothetical protein VMD77_02250 [Candidatus Baltobacteraceae bacterium]|nr:hypothetical protein [Candidatus Baltobacteraceae bacterium]